MFFSDTLYIAIGFHVCKSNLNVLKNRCHFNAVFTDTLWFRNVVLEFEDVFHFLREMMTLKVSRFVVVMHGCCLFIYLLLFFILFACLFYLIIIVKLKGACSDVSKSLENKFSLNLQICSLLKLIYRPRGKNLQICISFESNMRK